MKHSLIISDRDLGIVLRLLGNCDNSVRNSLGEPCRESARWAKRQIAKADRIRAIRSDLAAQRKARQSVKAANPALDEAMAKWEKRTEQMVEDIRSAERLTAKDLSLRVNCRG
jgi:hypothetical protein